MKIALLGFPQAGKKSLFRLLTGRDVPAGRKEDESIEGIAPIGDPRVDKLSELAHPERTRYAENNFVLCPDASDQDRRVWLDAARRCDLLCMVVRDFASPDVYHPKGSVDAARDRNDLEMELLLADMELLDKRLERLGKEKRAGLTPQQIQEEKTLQRCQAIAASGATLRTLELDEAERKSIASLGLVTRMPVLWVYNVDEARVAGAPPAPDGLVVSCQIEGEIMAMENAADRRAFMRDLGLAQSGLDRMNAAAYATLGLMSFYTSGPDEVRAWTIRKGATAPEAAGKIHSDIERGFIRVEVMKYDDLVAAGSEEAVKKLGRALVKGRDYVIEDGDICHFRFNV